MPDKRLLALAAAAIVCAFLFMTINTRGEWEFVLGFRGAKLLALIVVGASIAVATVLFQTISENRILTPSIVGFDALYVLFQAVIIFLLGGVGFASLNPEFKFVIETVLLCVAGMLLFGTLLGDGRSDLFRMLLVGVIFGVFFRSLTDLVQRVIDPGEFAIVQAVTFARFNSVDTALLWITATIATAAIVASWRLRHRLDVLALGREHAINLGLNHRREVLRVLALVAVLVSVSTAMVGPVAFFGLLVTALTHAIMRDHRHAMVLSASMLIAVVTLVGGQAVFEHLLGLRATLSVVVEFLGGFVFLFLVLRKRAL